MGLPIERLVIATNDNDILARTLATGEYRTKGVVATTSPSMDIQVSSNFERLLFEAAGRDAATVRRYMNGLKQSGAFTIETGEIASDPRRIRRRPRDDVDEVAATIRSTLEASNYLLDPHTAAAVHVAAGKAAGASADGGAGHRASGKVPGRRRGGLRRVAGPARMAGGLDGQPRKNTRYFHPT